MPSLFWKRDGKGGVKPNAADDSKAPLERRDAAYWIIKEYKIPQEDYDKLSLNELANKYPYIHANAYPEKKDGK